MNKGTLFNSKERIWQGPDWNPMYNSTVSIGQILVNAMAQHPSEIGQICHDDGSEMRNEEIVQAVVRVALNLKDLGLVEGNVIGIAARNSKYLAPVVFGAFTLGTPINTLDPLFEKDDIAHMFNITRPKIVLCDQENYLDVRGALLEIGTPVQVYIFCESDAVIPSGAKSIQELMAVHTGETTFVPPPISDGTRLPAAIVCSSGTTGPSKGVALTHAALCYQLFNTILDANQGRFFCFSSLYWLSGLASLLMTTYQNMTRVVTTQPFTPELLLEICKKNKLTGILTPPLQLAQVLRCPSLCSEDLDSLQDWLCGGAHVAEENCYRINEKMKNGKVTIGYGCSEIGGLGTKTSERYKSVGQLTRGMQVKIIDDSGRRLGPRERGEVCLKTRLPMCGYFGNEEATRNAIVDGWFHTGDIGYMDEGGDLHIVDRKKDIMKVGNYQIDPSEIENVILKSPEVVLVSVFALPDAVYTDAPAALIVKDSGSRLSQRDVEKIVEENLPRYKWLKGGVHFVEKMPTTPSGKIMKRVCRELVLNKGTM